MSNDLSAASSPYLLQHKDNPVHWYEWSEAAFAAARDADRPVLLSVGYATCHWCHVMAHESFEDEATAEYMNAHFVNIKVDREERPDIDRIYMDAVQAMAGQGGWPMTVFLTPDGEPFFAGTYFPLHDRGGHPSFRRVLEGISAAWEGKREDLLTQAHRLTEAIRGSIPPSAGAPDRAAVDGALADLIGRHDHVRGGFGGAPKFPQAPNLEVMLRTIGLNHSPDQTDQLSAMLVTTLDRMASGGIYDQLGGGFSRYSVDDAWQVPHFEKMLYDNALLARVYLRSWQLTGRDGFRRVATETLDYMLHDLADPAGGFHSGEDADSEGEEGKFYVWDWDELGTLLGGERSLVAARYGARPGGNFEGTNILHVAADIPSVAADLGTTAADVTTRLAEARKRLLAYRATRIRPSVDDKVVTAWNGLALRSFAEAAAVLGSTRYRAAAVRLAEFALDHLIRDERLLRTWRHGEAGPFGFCEDYGAMALGLFALYQVDGDERWYTAAASLVDTAIDLFGDEVDGGFFATARNGEQLIARPKNLMDNPTPSDNALMAEALLVLGALTGDERYSRLLEGTFQAAGRLIDQHPSAVGQMVAVLASHEHGPKEVALVGDDAARAELESVVWETFRPGCVVAPARRASTVVPLLRGRTPPDEGALAYVCRGFVCDLPVDDPGALRELL